MDEEDKRYLVVLTGAGVSAESGIPTFRDAGGLWTRFDPEVVCTAAGLYENPSMMLDFHNRLRKTIGESRPNHAHETIAALESTFNVTVITQNIDNLHERAGSTEVLHVHGDATKVTSSLHRLDPACIMDYPLERPILVGEKAADGSQLRPAVLLMDEYPYGTELAEYACRHAEIFLVVGTSLKIGLGPALVGMVPSDIPKCVIDPGDIDLPGFDHIRMTATKGIDDFVRKLDLL